MHGKVADLFSLVFKTSVYCTVCACYGIFFYKSISIFKYVGQNTGDQNKLQDTKPAVCKVGTDLPLPELMMTPTYHS